MASKRSLEDRLSRMEAARPRQTEEEDAQMRILRAMSTEDLRRLEGIAERVASGDPPLREWSFEDLGGHGALTVTEKAWLEETVKRAALAAATD